MNKNPNMTAISPIIIVITEKVLSTLFLMLIPMNIAEIPKNSKLNPTITEINPAENIGKIMKIKPRIMLNIPAPLLIIRIHLHLIN